jgi:hypothetical protein
MRNTFGQTWRLLKHFQSNPNQDLPAYELHKVGAGHEYGWCASITRRISDLRKMGLNVIVSRDERDSQGQRQTWYRYTP